MKRAPVITSLCVCLLCHALAGAQSLDSKFIDVEVKKKKKHFEVYVENLMPFDVTVTLDMTLSNMVSSDSLPYTGTMRGKERRQVLSLQSKDRRKAGSYRSQYFYTIGNMQAEHDSTYVYQLPYKIGATFPVLQSYNDMMTHDAPSRYAIDFGMPGGSHVCAAREGVVVGLFEDSDEGGPNESFNKKSNYVLVRHDDLTIASYHHLQKDGVMVRIGEEVEKGQVLAYSGATGFTFGPHLHFEVFKALDGKHTASFPLKFQTRQGILNEPLVNKSYRAD